MRDGEFLLAYRIMLGTGLRSMELAASVPAQFDFDRCRFTVDPAKTKNKRGGVLPVRPDLAADLKMWIEKHGIGATERIFRYTQNSILQAFYGDLKAAGIERKSADGRLLDVHSFRKTFGTMLARAGVPLTTTQRLMRHSTPELTAKLYIDVDPMEMSRALDKMPVF
ncbi:hypothetical protein FACS189419_09980 [Planctomycetales bacterium]|nr:hypothetical protein FACS189419_09980 [Planctomycetales bacterium]